MRASVSHSKKATQGTGIDPALGELSDVPTETKLPDLEQMAVKALMRREHSQWELQRKLRQKGYALEDITTVLQALIDKDLLSDQRFAESYVHMRVGRGYGPVRIANELRERRVADELIDACLADYAHLWQSQVQVVRNKRFGKLMPKDAASRAKQMRFLLYRGFTSEQINHLFNSK